MTTVCFQTIDLELISTIQISDMESSVLLFKELVTSDLIYT